MSLQARLLKFLEEKQRPLTFIERCAGLSYTSLMKLKSGKADGSLDFRVALDKYLTGVGY